jgi:glutamate/tyrosine decarboxylase-like PLP-dependent enzyme
MSEGSVTNSACHPSLDDQHFEQLRRDLAKPLDHPGLADLQNFATQTVDWLLSHFATLPEQAIGQSASRARMEELLREPAPEQGLPFARVLHQFETRVAPYACRVNHPRFLAFIPGSPTFLSVLGDWLCSGTNFFAGVWLEAAGPAQVELVVLDWFKALLGYPADAGGILTGGGSEANLTALLVARERLSFEKRSRAVLYVTEQRHWSMDRAVKVIGLRPDQLQHIPVGPDFRMNVDALGAALDRDRKASRLPWAVCANAGATNTGAVDPLIALADLCRKNRLWFHVDAAYGWSAVLGREGAKMLEGIGRADSVTLDPHKWFGQTFEVGCVLVREARRLAETFAVRPDYMQDVEAGRDEVNFFDHGLALTRRFRALKIWLSVKVLGLGWFRGLVDHCCRLAQLAQEILLRTPGFEILCPSQLSVVCFRKVPPQWPGQPGRPDQELDQLNLALIDAVRATGRAFLASTRLHGKVALRLCFVNWRTTTADVEEVIRLLTDAGDRLFHGNKE